MNSLKSWSFWRRVILFGLGGAIFYVCNTSIFLFLWRDLGWSKEIAYALSLTLMTGFTFAWSYFVNFRTTVSWRSCAKRYFLILLSCYAANYVMVQIGLYLMPTRPKLVILATQVLIAGYKFLIYHFWVFPQVSSEPMRNTSSGL